MSNLEKLSDEILALQSIFDKNFHLLDDNQYEISIDFDLMTPLTIEYEDQMSLIEYLPPFNLMIHYHDEYPSAYPPSFILSCFYFSKYHLQQLCQKLDNYPFVKGEVCVYDWINLIKLEITEKLILHHQFPDEENDPRALNGYTSDSAKKIFQYLIQYNAEQFQYQIQICSICDSSIRGVDCIRLCRCRHFFCQICLRNYIRTTLDNGQFGERVHCPHNQCQQALLPTEIKQILHDDHLYERYERLTLQHSLESMDDIIWCPRCQSPVLVDESDDNLAMCDQCRYIFCKKCKDMFHLQTICPRDEIIQQLQLQHRKGSNLPHEQISDVRLLQRKKDQQQVQRREEQTLAALAKVERKNRTLIEQNFATQKYRQITIKLSDEKALLEEILNAERIESLNTQPCPKCHVRIEKNGGCPSMHCSRCNHSFRWETIDKPEASQNISLLYKYMRQSEQIESVKEEVNQAANTAKTAKSNTTQIKEDSRISIDNRSAIGSAVVSRVKQCPFRSCKKFTAKIHKDNWIICSGCSKQYCFLCERPILGSQHFDKKCQRYTLI